MLHPTIDCVHIAITTAALDGDVVALAATAVVGSQRPTVSLRSTAGYSNAPPTAITTAAHLRLGRIFAYRIGFGKQPVLLE